MALDRPTFSDLRTRVYTDLASRFNPVTKSPRYNLLSIMADVDAGNYHQLYGDLSFLSDQIFPDTAEGAYLRAHWSDRVPPKSASKAVGTVTLPGTVATPIPVGLLFSSPAGLLYYTDTVQSVPAGGVATVAVKAMDPGSAGNLAAGTTLKIASTVPSGLSSQGTVTAAGLAGGVEEETDVDYLSRVLAWIRTGVRYGKTGDFAAWAVDSTAEVKKAFEIKNYSVFGALLVQVVGGNHTTGITPVVNLQAVSDYIAAAAPPVLFTVQTPSLVALNPSIHLLPAEDNSANRSLVLASIRAWLETYAKPNSTISPAQLMSAFVDGAIITGGSVTLSANPVVFTALQYPILGNPVWT